MSALVSVIIPCYNRERTLSATLASVARQQWRPLEIIAIDDGSRDSTLSILREFAATADFPVDITSRANRGVTVTRNEALRKARGDFIAFIDSDDTWQPEKLQLQMELFARNPAIGLCFTSIDFMDEVGQLTGDHRDADPSYRGRWLAEQIRFNQIPTSSVVMRRCVLDDVGLFDESLDACEDWDYWIRLAHRYDIDFLPQRLTRMRRHEVQMTRNIDLMRSTGFAVLDKTARTIARENPSIQPDIDYSRKYLHYLHGSVRLRGGDPVRARPDLLRAWGLKGKHFELLSLIAQSFVPARALASLKSWRGTATRHSAL